ncbi:hypothetical protein CIK75_01955 [Glutamicibacter sp. BW78]|uniref:SDR family NAD(P)-dependent oxidoreductase n=1 Tax=Glutamicibacter sp. BW78 TaxID=2024403 RepID=UPI000BB74085|nr:SDR family oxidoreductase [Glutamicibacter sp. BW78]PCC26605.1 hypothetical protein CIK75_01955 [Glutamicibacter sp. BW78]
MRLENKSAIITGAASGIGRATARRLAEDGAKLILVDYDEEALHETLDLVTGHGAEAHAVGADVSDSSAVHGYVQAAIENFGRVDLFHNNAGILQVPGLLHESSIEDFDQIVAVNLRGAFMGMKYVLEQMMLQGSGAIVNTASHAAIRAEPTMGMYAATKHALAGLTVTAASEYGPHGLRINAVCPGGVKTAMTAGMPESADLSGFGPMQRMAEPEEIAATVAFLLSEEASYINGVLLPVDGGLAV